MRTIIERLKTKDWNKVAAEMHRQGYSVVAQVLTKQECADLIKGYEADGTYRKTINMERYRFGMGEYKYFQYPLPPIVSDIRRTVYSYIAPIANKWMEELNIETKYPATHEVFKKICHENNQTKPTVLILKYGEGGFNTLHQDLYGDIYFPLQAVFFLNEIEEDYTGGEFVLTEQIPRAQSKANVLTPERGDMLVFTTNFRPVKGSRGYYRVNMKHGVSPLHNGNRHTLGIIFHDAI
jgi:uncharacterized protein